MRWTFLCLLGCAATQPPPQPPPPAPPPPQPVRVDFEVAGEATGEEPASCERAQSPEVKLAVGHWRSLRRGIGLVIDRREKHALIQFDHGATERLEARFFWFRTEYVRAGEEKVLEFRNDGATVVFVGGQEIYLHRDCDAEPL
jgi:hypothetical protein